MGTEDLAHPDSLQRQTSEQLKRDLLPPGTDASFITTWSWERGREGAAEYQTTFASDQNQLNPKRCCWSDTFICAGLGLGLL